MCNLGAFYGATNNNTTVHQPLLYVVDLGSLYVFDFILTRGTRKQKIVSKNRILL